MVLFVQLLTGSYKQVANHSLSAIEISKQSSIILKYVWIAVGKILIFPTRQILHLHEKVQLP